MNRNRIHCDERGWVLVVAIVVMSLLLGLGLATLALVDTQQQQGRYQRVREDSFNLAEGMLYSQSQILSRNWPSNPTRAFPTECTQANYSGTLNVTHCTNPATLTSSTGAANPIFAGSDFTGSGNVTWKVQVRDNGDASGNVLTNYVQATANAVQSKCSVPFTSTCSAAGGTLTACSSSSCTYDFNGDHQVFVRAEAQVRNKTRRLVALLRLEVHQVNFNTNVVQAAWIQSTNNGNNKVFVDAQPSGVTTASKIVLTCSPPAANCPDPQMTSAQKNQMNPPDAYATGQTVTAAMTDDDYSGFLAIADHYYNDSTGCPSQTNPDAWSGVTILDFSSNTNFCQLQSNGQVNSASSPGVLIINRGGIRWGGTVDYYGIVYARNLSPQSSAGLIDLGGGGVIHGQVTVDGPGGVIVGGTQGSIQFDPNAGPNLKTSGTAGLVQSTWRELTPAQ
jgi:hypothetical protein